VSARASRIDTPSHKVLTDHIEQFLGVMNELGFHGVDVIRRVMFGEGIGQVVLAGPIVHQELALTCVVLEPMPAHVHGQCQHMSMALERFSFIVPLANTSAVVLSTCMGVGGCGWPSSASVLMMGTASWAFK
jgi:hypothetical protein